MLNFKVYYQTPDTFKNTMMKGISYITLESLSSTHLFLKETNAKDIEDLYQRMQGEIWSPNSEAKELIKYKGLMHTSMSIGDVARDILNNIWYIIDTFGVKELNEFTNKITGGQHD